jgi:hypothetical protein
LRAPKENLVFGAHYSHGSVLSTPPFYPRPRVLVSLGASSITEASAKHSALAYLAVGRKGGGVELVLILIITFSCRRFTGGIPDLTKYGTCPNQVRLRLRAPHIFIIKLAQFCMVLCFFYLFIRAPFFCSNWVKKSPLVFFSAPEATGSTQKPIP